MKLGILTLVAVLQVIAFVGATPAGAAQDVTMYCYVGDRDSNEYVGTVDVFNVGTGPNSCNVMYESCGGNCTACYTDSDSREVCIDSAGRSFYN